MFAALAVCTSSWYAGNTSRTEARANSAIAGPSAPTASRNLASTPHRLVQPRSHLANTHGTAIRRT